MIARFGHAIKITPSSIRLRLMELDEEWAKALDTVLDEVELAVECHRDAEAALSVV
ncbi:MAG: hypothetical protein R2848_18310 [Thermomicrobiales bacterium]